jgi:purine-nucleoside phosphorylase
MNRIDPLVAAAASRVRTIAGGMQPTVAIILGSGLGELADGIESSVRIPFAELPGFVSSTARGHRGQVVIGRLAGTPVVALAGRFHRYEGWSLAQVTFPVRVMSALGAKTMIVSNAAGGLRPHFRVGDLMVIRDHINWIPARRPTEARGDDPVRSRSTADDSSDRADRNAADDIDHQRPHGFGGVSAATYDAALAQVAMAAGRDGDFAVHQGTYLATLGPTYETRAEYRMMRRLGADAVGMSTVPEAIVARRCGMRALAISMISNVARPDAVEETTHDEVLDAGRDAAPNLTRVVRAVISASSGSGLPTDHH